MQKLYNWLTREDGQTMAEYGVVLAVITTAACLGNTRFPPTPLSLVRRSTLMWRWTAMYSWPT